MSATHVLEWLKANPGWHYGLELVEAGVVSRSRLYITLGDLEQQGSVERYVPEALRPGIARPLYRAKVQPVAPASDGRVTLELRGRLDPDSPDMIVAEVSETEARLPCDVHVGAVVFRKGVKASVLQGKLDRDAETMARRDREVARLLDEVAALKQALGRFAAIKADDGDTFDRYPDECVIRCEVTAGDIRAARQAVRLSDSAFSTQENKR